METKITINKIHIPYMERVFNSYLNMFWNDVSYYKNGYFPEMPECLGYSQAEALYRANKEYDKAVDCIKLNRLYLKDKKTSFYFDNEIKLKDAIKHIIRENLREAFAYKEFDEKHLHSGYIYMCYKTAVYLLDLLRQIDNKYNCVNAKYFLYNN